jgi:hypothetical protein
VVALVFAASCSGDNDGDGGGGDEWEKSPLYEYFGHEIMFIDRGMGKPYVVPPVDGDGMTEEESQGHRDFEAAVADCMADHGFEYVPVPPTEYEPDHLDEAFALPLDEFREKFGYGVSTLDTTTSMDEMLEDPNMEIHQNLSPQAQREYEDALEGTKLAAEFRGESVGDATAEPEVLTDEDIGCLGLAAEQTSGRSRYDSPDPFDGFESLLDDISQIGERLRSHPRIEEATQNWRDCLADAGYPGFDTVGDPEQLVRQRYYEMMGWSVFEADDDVESPEVVEEPGLAPAEDETFQEFELDLAGADWACQQEHYNDVAAEVQIELEEQFVEDHRDELESFRAQMDEHQGSP